MDFMQIVSFDALCLKLDIYKLDMSGTFGHSLN